MVFHGVSIAGHGDSIYLLLLGLPQPTPVWGLIFLLFQLPSFSFLVVLGKTLSQALLKDFASNTYGRGYIKS